MKRFDMVKVRQETFLDWRQGYKFLLAYGSRFIVVNCKNDGIEVYSHCEFDVFKPIPGQMVKVRQNNHCWGIRKFFAMDGDKYVCVENREPIGPSDGTYFAWDKCERYR